MARFTWIMTLGVCASLAWLGCSAGDGESEFEALERSSEEAWTDTSEAEPIGTLEAASP